MGKSVEEALGTSWTQIVHPDDLPLTIERWRRSLQTGEPYEVEHRVLRSDGVYRWFLVRAVPMRDGEGRILKWFGTSTDVEDLKRAEAENARLLAEAIPGAELQVWDRAGHLYFTDEPRADREVARFLLRHTPELRGPRRLLARMRRLAPRAR